MSYWSIRLLLFFLLLNGGLLAQKSKTYTILFEPKFGEVELKLNDSFYKTGNGDSIQFENLKFYISGIQLLNENKIVFKEENSFYLADASDKKSLSIAIQIPSNLTFNAVSFNLGIDSITNSAGALGGNLDPTMGMYWTWQNGYINFKLEGKCNRCTTRNNEFQFHLGGYQDPFNTLQKVNLKVRNNDNTVIEMDIQKWISEIDLSSQNHIMSPCKEAVMLSQKLLQTFSISGN